MSRSDFTYRGIKRIKDGAKCEICGTQCALEAHHRIPLVLLDDELGNSDENMVILCETCHGNVHRASASRSMLTKIGIRKCSVSAQTISRVSLLRKIYDGDLRSDDILELIFEEPCVGITIPSNEDIEFLNRFKKVD